MNSDFKVGVNLDLQLLETLAKLNEEYNEKGNRITEVYGSIRQHQETAARPGFRLPDKTLTELRHYVGRCKELGIDFNYTMNSIFPYGTKKDFVANQDAICDLVRFLEEIGVKRVTVGSPALLEYLKEIGTTLKVEISTIMHIDTITQIRYIKDNYDFVDKICGNLNKNRDAIFLKGAADYCSKNDLKYEVMVNEFCGVGGKDYSTHCIYRDSCYICHATNETLCDANSFNKYPMDLCTASRDKDMYNWLKLKFIRPEDLHYYEKLGIHNFKITGRTGSSEYIERTVGSYLAEDFNGNLLELWKPLESIMDPSISDLSHTNHYIDNKKLDGFLKQWFNPVFGYHICDYEVCGETCTYCQKFYEGKVGKC